MIVEVFFRGSSFKEFYDTFWNIKKINRSGHYFLLVREYEDKEYIIYLDTEKYELRVTY